MSEIADETAVSEEPVAEEPVAEAPAAAEPAAPAVDPLELQAELEHLRGQNAELYSILQQATQGTGEQPAAASAPNFFDDYGNFDPNKFAAWQEQRDAVLVQQFGQQVAPIHQSFAQQQEAAVIAEGEQRLADILADDVSRNGEFAADPEADAQARELVQTLASNMFPEIADRYGSNPRAAEIAMNKAAAQVRGLLGKVGGAAVTQNQNQLATLAEARGEPGAHGAGVEAPVIRLGETSAARFAASGGSTVA